MANTEEMRCDDDTSFGNFHLILSMDCWWPWMIVAYAFIMTLNNLYEKGKPALQKRYSFHRFWRNFSKKNKNKTMYFPIKVSIEYTRSVFPILPLILNLKVSVEVSGCTFTCWCQRLHSTVIRVDVTGYAQHHRRTLFNKKFSAVQTLIFPKCNCCLLILNRI